MESAPALYAEAMAVMALVHFAFWELKANRAQQGLLRCRRTQDLHAVPARKRPFSTHGAAPEMCLRESGPAVNAEAMPTMTLVHFAFRCLMADGTHQRLLHGWHVPKF